MPLQGFEVCSFEVACDRRIEAVAELSRAAQAAGSLPGIVDDVAARCGATAAAVTLVSDHAVLVAAARGLPGWIHEAGGVPASWLPCCRVARNDRPVVIDDLRLEPGDVLRPATVLPHLRSYVGVPLRAHGHVAGALCMLADRPAAFDTGTLIALQDAVGRVQRELGITAAHLH